MNQVRCAGCARVVEFSGERPKFCGNCGRQLANVKAGSTAEVDPQAATLPPEYDPEAATLAPSGPRSENCEVPEMVGGYKLLRRLGGGGMGSVYEAEDPVSGRRVALKLVLPEYADSPEAVERFRQEGRLASTLAHPRSVFVLAADEDAGQPYIVMELMPGSTLDDLVKEQGALPPDQAIAKILDVIDGLRESHRLGLVHRDVKPSNCFLEANGRVKVGDFGLAKSLVSDSKLTRTGTFLGTPLFAAPEQIKSERVDAQSDVYSVAATLYYLLAGQAPFQTGDALATLARIVSDDPPPLRSLRPELSKALDKVVLRGLERDRKRRWRDLDEFRKALVPFLPAQPSIGGAGLRFVASLIDGVIVMLTGWVLGQAVGQGLIAPATRAGLLPVLEPRVALLFYGQIVGALIAFSYYGVLEGLWGWSPGKRLLRLRVGTVNGDQPPGVGRALLRHGVLYALFTLEPVAVQYVMISLLPADLKPPTALTNERGLVLALIGLFNVVWLGLAVGATVSTMRLRNGYRGLHEFLSGTRTYRLHWPQARKGQALKMPEFHPQITRPDGMPESVGIFRIRGALRWTDRERAFLGEDPQLGRTVWIWLRPLREPSLNAAHRNLSRASRARWVGCGVLGDWQWDAYLAPAGMPLPSLAALRHRLTWTAVRPILEDLADELAASCADGTLPSSLSVEQVWVATDARVQLLGTPLAGSEDQGSGAKANGEVSSAIPSDQERALGLLRQVAATALEGKPRPIEASPSSVRAPVPVHAARVLDRLFGVKEVYETVGQFQKDLDLLRDRATEVTRLRRAGHLALMALLLHIPFFLPVWLVVLSFAVLLDHWQAHQLHRLPDGHQPVYVVTALCLAYWVLWTFIFRGGYAFWRGGIALRRKDGRKPTRLQCAYRTFLVWAPVCGLFALSAGVAHAFPALPVLYFGIWTAGIILLLVYVVLAIRYPTRSLHDWLAGTYLVPE